MTSRPTLAVVMVTRPHSPKLNLMTSPLGVSSCKISNQIRSPKKVVESS